MLTIKILFTIIIIIVIIIINNNNNKDQALATTNIHAKVYHFADSPKCRKCGKKDETVAHIVSGCETLDDAVCMNKNSRSNLLF